MQKVVLLLAMFTCIMSVNAQVSDSKIIAEIKKQEPATLTVQLENSITEKEYENGSLVNYYRRMYHSVESTKWNGVTYHYYGGAQYKIIGGKYVFDRLTVGDGHYEGFAAPNKAEIMSFVKQQGTQFFGSKFNKIIGIDVPEITLVDGEKWTWHSLKSVSGKVKCIFTVPTNYTTLEKAEHVFDLRLYSDGNKATDTLAKWVRLSVSEKSNEKKVLGTTTHTSAEIKAMPTLASAAATAVANDELASLPKIESIPVFETSIELIYFIHNIIMTKSPNEIKAYLYHLAASNCRAGKQINMMTSYAQSWIDKIVANEATYKKTHCQYPAIKHKQSNMAELYDKKQIRKIRFSAQQENGSWFLSGIEYYPAKASEIAEIAAADNCGSESDYVVVKREVKTYNIGDAVDATFSNGTFPCTVQKIDPANRNRYYVVLNSNNSGYWMDEINLAPGSSDLFKFKVGDAVNCEFSNGNFPCTVTGIDKTAQKYEVALSNGSKYWVFAQTVTERAEPSFKIGDKVAINTVNGKMNATVTKVMDGKCEIKYADPRYGKQVVANANISK